MKLINQDHLRKIVGAKTTITMKAVDTYFRARYPKSSDSDRATAQALLWKYLGHQHDLEPSPMSLYVEAAILSMLVLADQNDDNSYEQTKMVFDLIETLIFRVRAERVTSLRADWIDKGKGDGESTDSLGLIREAIALLEATKTAFKSKLVAEAKEKLQRAETQLKTERGNL